MKSLFKIFLFCPIPENQKPIDQYITLKENLFYNWIFLNEKEYKKYIVFGTIFLNLFFFLFLNFHYSFDKVRNYSSIPFVGNVDAFAFWEYAWKFALFGSEPWGHIFSCVRSFYEWAVSDLDP